jgi:uncharacterized protein (TIGR02453 family)
MMSFSGFPAETFLFLRELGDNNNKLWFEANKSRYLQDVQSPALELVVALGTRLQAEFPRIQFDTALNGSGSLMRIYRDTRFSKDKSPYKTNIAMIFNEGGKKMNSTGFGLQITPEYAELMAGLFAFDKVQLETYRNSVVSDKEGKALLKAVKAVQAKGSYQIEGKHYKTNPKGYPILNDERSELLLHNGLWAAFSPISEAEVMSPEFPEIVFQHFKAINPIRQCLADILA